MISLIHPSRGRPEKSNANTSYWYDKAKRRYDLELLVSCDMDDNWLAYERLYGDSVVIVRTNTSVVEATNRAARESNGDILVYLSDDFKCPDKWDELILKEFEGVTEPMLLKVDDCLQKFDVPVLTIPIMNRALYNKLGYFWHPAYKSMFVDEDLYWTCRKLNCIKFAPHLKFPHEHCSIGKAERDDTYIRSEKNWDQGKAVFAERKKLNFPL